MPCLKLSLYSFEMFKENPENNILPYFIHDKTEALREET